MGAESGLSKVSCESSLIPDSLRLSAPLGCVCSFDSTLAKGDPMIPPLVVVLAVPRLPSCLAVVRLLPGSAVAKCRSDAGLLALQHFAGGFGC